MQHPSICFNSQCTMVQCHLCRWRSPRLNALSILVYSHPDWLSSAQLTLSHTGQLVFSCTLRTRMTTNTEKSSHSQIIFYWIWTLFSQCLPFLFSLLSWVLHCCCMKRLLMMGTNICVTVTSQCLVMKVMLSNTQQFSSDRCQRGEIAEITYFPLLLCFIKC